MTTFNKTLAAAAAALITSTGIVSAQTVVTELNVAQARLDTSLDTNGDSTVDDNEIIAGYQGLFDINGSGTLDASERALAEQMLMDGSVITTAMVIETSGGMMIEFDAAAARLDLSLDTDGDSQVSDAEIIEGNMALFDTNASGTIDAAERSQAEQALATGSSVIVVPAVAATAGEQSGSVIDFNVNEARLNTALDTNSDGEVDIDEIINGNMMVFDTNNSGAIDAEERAVAEELLMNG